MYPSDSSSYKTITNTTTVFFSFFYTVFRWPGLSYIKYSYFIDHYIAHCFVLLVKGALPSVLHCWLRLCNIIYCLD